MQNVSRLTGIRSAMQGGSAEAVMSRRDLLSLIGTIAGSAAMYHAMTSLGFASDSAYKGPLSLTAMSGAHPSSILGAGLAGMTAALELRKAGYRVQVLEFNRSAGGRNWTLRGGDTFIELGGYKQTCEFEQGLYFNPGPWRIPYHHRALLDYCKRLGVALEPFIQLNHNAYLHAVARVRRRATAYPRRSRPIFKDKSPSCSPRRPQQGKLDEAVSTEDKEILLQALQIMGRARQHYAYNANLISADFRGYAQRSRRRAWRAPIAGEPIGLSDILKSRLWRYLQNFAAL